MKKILLNLIFVLLGFSAYSQHNVTKSFYYATDEYRLSRKQKTELKAFLESAVYGGKGIKNIEIHGHTDSSASNAYNIQLSQRRSTEIQKFIMHQNIKNVPVEMKSFGENKPRYKYVSQGAMAKNRRVDIEIIFSDPDGNSGTVTSSTTIFDLYKLLENSADTFYIHNNHDTILEARNGTLVHFKAGTICGMENSWDRIKIAVKEVLNTSEMITQNASTGSGENLLITGGMVQVLAFDMKNKPLQLCDNRSFTLLVPDAEPDTAMQLFYASRGKDFGLDWELQNPEEKLEVVGGDVFRNCIYGSGGGNGDGSGGFCPLFFCKIEIAIDRAIVYLERVIKKTFAGRRKRQTADFTRYQMRAINSALVDVCENRAQRIKEIEEKYNGINTAKLEDLTAAEANYYIFNSTQLGWINCDRFGGYPPALLTNVKLPMSAASTTDVKLIMNNERAIMPSYDLGGNIGFPNVPKGATAKILALKYENGQPSLALQEIKIGDDLEQLELEFKDYSLIELKKMIEGF